MKKWICIGLFLIGTCSVQAQDLVSDFLAKTKENKVFTQVNISSRMFQMISEITDAETESIIRNLTGMKMLTTEQETDRYFQEVRALYVDINGKLFHNELEYLSMGMSGDYEDAIRCGATMVRVGSAIFGARHYQ